LYGAAQTDVKGCRPTGEVAETLEKAGKVSKWKSPGLMLSRVAIVVGSEPLVEGPKAINGRLGLSDSLFRMTILSFLASMEALVR
jgi:hypothetical protein